MRSLYPHGPSPIPTRLPLTILRLSNPLIPMLVPMLVMLLIAATATILALREHAKRKHLERCLATTRSELLLEFRDYAENVLGSLVARALQSPTSYYAHRISEALDHVETMVESTIRHWRSETERIPKARALSASVIGGDPIDALWP